MFFIVIFFLHEKKCGISIMDHELWKWTIQFIQWFINDELGITYENWLYIYYKPWIMHNELNNSFKNRYIEWWIMNYKWSLSLMDED